MSTSETAFSKLVGSVAQLASQHQWSDIEQQALSLLEPATDILLLNARSVSHQAFEEWVRRTCASASVKVLTIHDLTSRSVEADKAKLLVVALVCGEALDAQELEALELAVTPRAPGSCALVLTGAEQIESVEELRIVERSAWWALVPEPKAVWNEQDLTEHYIFLWSRLGGVEFLSARLQKERQELSKLLSLGGANPPSRKDVLLKLLNVCEERLSVETVAAQPKDVLTRVRSLQRVADELAEIRIRFSRRMDQESALITEELTIQLQTLQRALTRNLKPAIEKETTGMLVSEKALRNVLTHFLAGAFEGWPTRTESYIRGRLESQLNELRQELQSLDWTVINTLPRTSGYPDHLFAQSDIWHVKVTLAPPSPSDPADPSSPTGFSSEGIAVAGLATAATLGFLGAVVPAVGAALLTPAALHLYKNQNRQKWFDSGKNVIQREISALIEQLPAIGESNVRSKKDLVRQALDSIERTVRGSVDQLYMESSGDRATPPSRTEDLARLEQLRDDVKADVE